MTWKQKTHSVIQDCFIELASATGRIIGPSSSDKDKTEVMRMIRASYPFGQRKHFPYKVWCTDGTYETVRQLYRNGRLIVTVEAKDVPHAVKIANEIRTRMIASGEWPEEQVNERQRRNSQTRIQHDKHEF